jgi:hypothetical protein
MVSRFYTGVGSRSTPGDITALMRELAVALGRSGWTLRSGGAEGADQAFEAGAVRVESYRPWRRRGEPGIVIEDPNLLHRAREILRAEDVYPDFSGIESALESLDEAPAEGRERRSGTERRRRKLWATLALQTRNVFQVLGADLRSPSRFLVCWTPDGAVDFSGYKRGRTGGTGTAINLAAKHGIPVFNLQRPEHRLRITGWLREVRAQRSAEAARPEPTLNGEP